MDGREAKKGWRIYEEGRPPSSPFPSVKPASGSPASRALTTDRLWQDPSFFFSFFFFFILRDRIKAMPEERKGKYDAKRPLGTKRNIPRSFRSSSASSFLYSSAEALKIKAFFAAAPRSLAVEGLGLLLMGKRGNRVVRPLLVHDDNDDVRSFSFSFSFFFR